MQKKSLLPTPLSPQTARKAIEIVEPSATDQNRFRHILWFMFGLMGGYLAARLWPPWAHGRFSSGNQARRMRLFMEQMGGLWVKVGQILAMRRDLFSEVFCDELALLQNRAQGFPARYARSIIEEDLGLSIDTIFAEFEDAPLAAASVGQAHLARLKDSGAEVVVKVQRPNVAASFAKDFSVLFRFIKLLVTLRIAPFFRWMEMYTAIESAILEELDYRQEASTLRRMRKNLRRHKIYAPKVYMQYCSDRVLVMEKVGGVYMSEYIKVASSDPERVAAWRKENQIRPRRVGKRLWFSYLRQLFEDNLYHSDLHPGNILLMRKNRITLIDFGSVGTTDATLLQKFRLLYKSMGEKDYRKVAEMFLLIAPPLPNKDLGDVKEMVIRHYREFESLAKIKTLPYHDKSMNRLLGNVSNALTAHGVPASWDFLRSLRASTTLDASLMFLIPDVNYLKLAQQYIEGSRERLQKKPRDPKVVRAQLANAVEQGRMVSKLAENVYFEGEYLRQRALSFEGYLSKAARIGYALFHILSRATLLVAVVFILGYVHQRFDALRLLRGTRVYAQLERFPPTQTQLWFFWIFVAMYLTHEFNLLKRVFKEPEPTQQTGDRR